MKPEENNELEQKRTSSNVSTDSRCPWCGGKPTEDSQLKSNLNDMGYISNNIELDCQDCGRPWRIATPQETPDKEKWQDLACPSCGDFGRVHRVANRGKITEILMKCHNHSELNCPNCDTIISSDERVVTPSGDSPLSCPHCSSQLDRNDIPGCFHYWNIYRQQDDRGFSLIGQPHTTGEMEDADPFGWVEDKEFAPKREEGEIEGYDPR